MRDLTVDVCVLLSAAGDPDHYGTQREDAVELMDTMLQEDGWAYAVDRDDRIRRQYFRKLRTTAGLRTPDFVVRWLTVMRSRGKEVLVTSLPPQRSTVVDDCIGQCSLTREDGRYVRTAAAAGCKVLVSHNSRCYTRPVRRRLRTLGVRVFAPSTAQRALR